MRLNAFKATIDIYLMQLERYDQEALCLKPDDYSWSIGQVYMHLLEETKWYFEQIELCLGNSEHVEESMTEQAKGMFRNDSFPNEIIKGDPLISEQVEQPSSKEAIRKRFEKLKSEALSVWNSIGSATQRGKRKHPGLGFFGPEEWFQYAEMHLRHHLRQKDRIDLFLNGR